MTVAGFTSTGSKRPEALFGADGAPALRMVSSSGCRVRASDGREYLDFVMALGAVALGYGHPAVDRAAWDAIRRGTIGPLAPEDEPELARELGEAVPALEQVRFLKTGAEAVAAAVRLARAATGRDGVLGCGYHGWLDWSSTEPGVPAAVQGLFTAIPFGDAERARDAIRRAGDRLACVVVEPVVDGPPPPEWLAVLLEETRRVGAVLVFDEIKTAFRVGLEGAAGRWGGEPDLIVLGKALANGWPLAAVGGRADLMERVRDTWISSTTATEFVSLAAARATLAAVRETDLPARIAERGERLYRGLEKLAAAFPRHLAGVAGLPEMCFLRFTDEAASARVARGCLERGVLFKRTAYNFVSLAHDEAAIDRGLEVLHDVLEGLG